MGTRFALSPKPPEFETESIPALESVSRLLRTGTWVVEVGTRTSRRVDLGRQGPLPDRPGGHWSCRETCVDWATWGPG